jgi:hypothetical protein
MLSRFQKNRPLKLDVKIDRNQDSQDSVKRRFIVPIKIKPLQGVTSADFLKKLAFGKRGIKKG